MCMTHRLLLMWVLARRYRIQAFQHMHTSPLFCTSLLCSFFLLFSLIKKLGKKDFQSFFFFCSWCFSMFYLFLFSICNFFLHNLNYNKNIVPNKHHVEISFFFTIHTILPFCKSFSFFFLGEENCFFSLSLKGILPELTIHLFTHIYTIKYTNNTNLGNSRRFKIL